MHRTQKEKLLGRSVEVPARNWEFPFPDPRALAAFEKANHRHRLNAKKRCDRITATPPEDQRLLILRHRRTYISYPVIEELFRRIKEVIFTDPLRAQEMARAALLIAKELNPWMLHMATPALCKQALARSHAHLGNVCRVLRNWEEAEGHFERALKLLWKGVGDPLVHAEVQSLRGSFLCDRQQFEEAIAALEESAAVYEELGEQHRAGVVLLQLAATHCLQGAPNKALPIHIQGVDKVDEERHPVIAAAAWNNLVRIYLYLEQFETADATLRSAPSFYDLCPPDSSIHWDRAWTEGCVQAGLGQFQEALDRFQEAWEGFRGRDPYNAALVQLDRLRVLLKQDRLHELEASARLVYQTLRTQPLEREAQEALRLLVVAAGRRQLAESMVEQAVAALRKHPSPPRIHKF